MSARYNDRDDDRDFQNYGRRSESDYGRSYDERSEGSYGYGGRQRESERYGREGGFDREYGGRPPWSSQRGYTSGGERLGSGSWESERNYPRERERDRTYGRYGREYDEGRSSRLSGPSQRYNYPSGFRSGERYGERERDYDYERGSYGREEDRGWLDRAADAIASWFGDEEAERRRRIDHQRQQFRGRGPKGYRRSDERIKEDINDRLSDDDYLDASDIEVTVSDTEVTLIGFVNSRDDKRRAEDIVEGVSGVTNVENRLRSRQIGTSTSTGTTGAVGTTGSSGTTETASSAAAGATSSGRARGASGQGVL